MTVLLSGLNIKEPAGIGVVAAIKWAMQSSIYGTLAGFPLLKPVNATVAILATLWIWNDFLLPLVMLNREMKYWTIPMFQYNFNTGYYFNYNQAAAALFIAIIPMIIFYLFMQKYIIGGLVKGAIKG